MRLSKLATLSVYAVLLSACHDEGSSSIPTDEIYPRFNVRTDEAGQSQLSADLVKSEFVNVQLEGGDKLVVTSGTTSVTLSGGDGVLTAGNAENTAFKFDFQRSSGIDAPNSQGTLPAPMGLSAPTAGTAFSAQNDTVPTRWSNAGRLDQMSVEVRGSCRTFSGTKPPDFLVTIDLNGDLGFANISLSGNVESELSPSCSVYDATYSLLRTRNGEIDSAFAPKESDCTSGCLHLEYFVLSQIRSVPITINNTPS